MRLFIDIGHPAHVHYFRNFIAVMTSKGHQFVVTARSKEITHQLLDSYGIDYISRGKGGHGVIGKAAYIFQGDYTLYKLGKRFAPDLFISFGSAYAAHASRLLNKPHIAFDDTEHAIIEHALFAPFTECIITPWSYKKNFGRKHVRFVGTMDLAYLHPKYFTPDMDYLRSLRLLDKPLFVVRFVDWSASHDARQRGLTEQMKDRIVDLLAGHGEVIISSEGSMPEKFSKYRYTGDPAKIHSLLYQATLFVGESGSMGTEAAVLGTHSIVINSATKYFGVFHYLREFGNLSYYDSESEPVERIDSLLHNPDLKKESRINSATFLKNTINLTDLMIWFVENYPESVRVMKENPEYQYNFR
jgi:uncharacterized protein